MNPNLLAERVEGVIVSIRRRQQLHSLAQGIIDKTGRGGAARRRGRLCHPAFGVLEPTTNLYPTPFRRYSSTQGRWLSPDPLAGSVFNPQSLNRYAYVVNRPTSLVDPLGLDNHGAPPCGPKPDQKPCPQPEPPSIFNADVGPPPSIMLPTSLGAPDMAIAEAQFDWNVNAIWDEEYVQAEAEKGIPISELQAFASTRPEISIDFGLLASVTVNHAGAIGQFDLYGYSIVQNPLKIAGMQASFLEGVGFPLAWYGASAALAVGGPLGLEAAGGYPGLYVHASNAGLAASYAAAGWALPAGTGVVGFVAYWITWMFGD